MSLPDRHPDGTTPGLLVPGQASKTPWLKPTPLKRLYTTTPGQVPHFSAIPTDARRGVMFAKFADLDFGFVLYGVKDFNFTHAQYVQMYNLKSTEHELGPPGTYKNRNQITFGKQVN